MELLTPAIALRRAEWYVEKTGKPYAIVRRADHTLDVVPLRDAVDENIIEVIHQPRSYPQRTHLEPSV